MRLLVTGHRGYIGCLLVPMLEAADHTVRGLDSDLYRDCQFGEDKLPAADYRLDIRDVNETMLEGFDTIIHLAGLSNDPLGNLDPELTYAINLEASVRLARLARQVGVKRFVFSSSCSNYGAAGEDWITEDAPLNPITPYAVSKARAEEELDKLADENFTPVFLRSGTAYGVSPRIRFDLVVNNLTAWAVATGRVFLKSDGSAWRPLVHAEDMAQAFVCAVSADRDAVHRQAFNVGRNADCVQIRDVARMIERAVPGSQIVFSEDHFVDQRTYRVDCTKITGIGFDPQWSLERGIDELRDNFIRHGVTVAEFEGERFQRVAHVQSRLASGQLGPDLRHRRSEALA